MAALPSTLPRWSVERYLEIEGSSTIRHEYLAGHIYALAGGTQAHGVIMMNVGSLARVAPRGKPCRVYSSDVKVRVNKETFFSPDVSIGCDPDDRRDRSGWITAPRVVEEVLSEGTAAYDRGNKFAIYRQIATLRDYVLVETERQRVEVHSRQEEGAWTMRAFSPGAVAVLPSLDLHLPLDEIYEDTDVPTA
jgi:Uma2 family endonuclease